MYSFTFECWLPEVPDCKQVLEKAVHGGPTCKPELARDIGFRVEARGLGPYGSSAIIYCQRRDNATGFCFCASSAHPTARFPAWYRNWDRSVAFLTGFGADREELHHSGRLTLSTHQRTCFCGKLAGHSCILMSTQDLSALWIMTRR